MAVAAEGQVIAAICPRPWPVPARGAPAAARVPAAALPQPGAPGAPGVEARSAARRHPGAAGRPDHGRDAICGPAVRRHLRGLRRRAGVGAVAAGERPASGSDGAAPASAGAVAALAVAGGGALVVGLDFEGPDRLAGELLDGRDIFAVDRGGDGDRRAGQSGAAGAADAVDIVLGVGAARRN